MKKRIIILGSVVVAVIVLWSATWLVVAGMVESTLAQWLGFFAVVMATINVVGGYLVTDRMLQMFRRKERPAARDGAGS